MLAGLMQIVGNLVLPMLTWVHEQQSKQTKEKPMMLAIDNLYLDLRDIANEIELSEFASDLSDDEQMAETSGKWDATYSEFNCPYPIGSLEFYSYCDGFLSVSPDDDYAAGQLDAAMGYKEGFLSRQPGSPEFEAYALSYGEAIRALTERAIAQPF